MCFGSRGPREVSGGPSSRIRERNASTEKAWRDAVQGLGESDVTLALLDHEI